MPVSHSEPPLPDVAAWAASRPESIGEYQSASTVFSRFWQAGLNLLSQLPPKPKRVEDEAAVAETILRVGRESRERYLTLHTETTYSRLTSDYRSFVRVEDLAYAAADLVPGLAPTREQVRLESSRAQRDKDGFEVDQGIFLSHVLANENAGKHLCHAMLLPRVEALDRLAELRSSGVVDLGPARVERRGKASIVTLSHPKFLNAEDDTTIDAAEIAVDLAILDPETEVAVMLGGPVDHAKYAGRRVFSAGINLTHLYDGRIPFLWYLRRDLGVVNKIFRGLATPEADPDELAGGTIEKPWFAGVDAFAIGGGCQYLLVMDYVVAASDAYMTLPARKEGIIPGAANLRLPRFTGDRIARQAVLSGLRLDCDSPEGRMICDEVVSPDQVDAALERVIDNFTNSGVVSAAGNRRAFRVGLEPLDLFRRYMAVYAREQAYCHFSPALIDNLERHWNAQQRRR